MNGLGVVDRLGVMFPMLVIEVVVLVVLSFLYYIAVHRKMIKDDWVVAKLFVTFWGIWQFALMGIVFAPLIMIISAFQTGPRAIVTRDLSVIPFLVMGWFGLVRGVWVYLTLKVPPSDKNPDTGPEDIPEATDSVTEWSLKPAFSYRNEGRNEGVNIIVVGVLAAAMATFLVLDGAGTLLAAMVPSALPNSLAARLLRSAGADGPVEDGLLLLGFGILTWVGGGALLWSAWKRLLRTRPLTINRRGVYAYYRGRPLRFLAWGDVKAISKLRIDMRPRPGIVIRIESADLTLVITPRISEYAAVCRSISIYARENAIRLQFIDTGRDTIKAQRTVVPPEGYRKIARDGLITEIADL